MPVQQGSKGRDPSIQYLQISDFSPGIVKYGLGNQPVTYSPNTPLGSASYAVRCFNKPNVGLMPMPNYSLLANTIDNQHAQGNSAIFIGSIATMGPFSSGIFNPSKPGYAYLSYPFNDYIFVSECHNDNSGNYYNDVFQFAVANGHYTESGQIWSSTVSTTNTLTNTLPGFTVTSFTRSDSGNLYGALVWNDSLNNNVVFFPPLTGTTDYGSFAVSASYATPLMLVAYGARLGINYVTGITTEPADVYYRILQQSAGFIVSDPPETQTFYATPQYYDTENWSGWGAWGSVSTGELLLIHQGRGAVVINGDFLYPSSVTRLPGVEGTGNIIQKALATEIGLVYVTQNNGVFAWNGGNSANKISSQIPDDACVRPEFMPGQQTVNTPAGYFSCHDEKHNFIFFANNWVYDVINTAWWQLEDTSIISFPVWAASTTNERYIYSAVLQTQTPVNGVVPVPSGYVASDTLSTPTYVEAYVVDFLTPQVSWAWTSNPIPVSVDQLVELRSVELVVSNPNPYPATMTVTPTAPPGQVARQGNNPQTVTFIIPADVAGYRCASELGYTDWNIEIAITATSTTTISGIPAPILHGINIGFVPSSEATSING